MSLDATRWAWQQQNITATQKLVLLAIADRAGESHCAYPSIARLERDTCLNRKTIIACLDSLEVLGFVRDTSERVGRTGKVKVYQLVGVEGRHNDTDIGTIKQSQNGDSSTVPKTEPLNSAETGTIESVNSPENGTPKQSQNWDSESISKESNTNTPLPPAEAEGQSPAKADDGSRQKKRSRSKPAPDYQGVIDAFNEILGDDLAEVRILNEPRKRAIRTMWNYRFSAKATGDSVDFWRRYFSHVLTSKPLTGRKPGFDWRATFDWLMKEKSIARVIEGEFHQGEDIRDDLPADGGDQ